MVLKRIVFFWVGEDVAVPSYLVASIRRQLHGAVEIVQLSDRRTPRVEGTTDYRALDLSSSIMVARLEAYSSLAVTEPTLYLDADMLVVRPFDLPGLGPDEIGVTRRTQRDDGLIQEAADPPVFPEFRGKLLGEVMPYIYSFVYTASELLFVRQLEQLRNASPSFHAWFGDQVTLKNEIESGRFRVRMFDAEQYNRTVRSRAEYDEVLASANPPFIVHFKGAGAKEAMRDITMPPAPAPAKAARWWKWWG